MDNIFKKNLLGLDPSPFQVINLPTLIIKLIMTNFWFFPFSKHYKSKNNTLHYTAILSKS